MTLFCPIRKAFCNALPEEVVRIALLEHMIKELGFPQHTLAVEKELSSLPHVLPKSIPKRRADILCFTKGIHLEFDLYPLLLIECKAIKLTRKTINQVVGYNQFVNAYFIAIANSNSIRTGYRTPDGFYKFVDYLPEYQELMMSISLSER